MKRIDPVLGDDVADDRQAQPVTGAGSSARRPAVPRRSSSSGATPGPSSSTLKASRVVARVGRHNHPHPRTRPFAGVVEQVAEELQHVPRIHRPGCARPPPARCAGHARHAGAATPRPARRAGRAASKRPPRAAAGEAGAAAARLDGRAHGLELGADRVGVLRIAARGERIRALAEHRERRLEGVERLPAAWRMRPRRWAWWRDRRSTAASMAHSAGASASNCTARCRAPAAGEASTAKSSGASPRTSTRRWSTQQARQRQHGQRLGGNRDRGVDRGRSSASAMLTARPSAPGCARPDHQQRLTGQAGEPRRRPVSGACPAGRGPHPRSSASATAARRGGPRSNAPDSGRS